MRRLIVVIAICLSADPLVAQSGHDANASDVLKQLHEIQGSLDAVMKPVAAETRALELLNAAMDDLGSRDRQALDRALERIDEAEKGAEQSEKAASQLRAPLREARQLVTNARLDAYFSNYAGLREQIHHDCVHPIVRITLLELVSVQMVDEQLSRLREEVERNVTATLRGVANVSAAAHR